LILFIELKEDNLLSDSKKATVIESLNKYLLDNEVNDENSKFISAFIIKNQNNTNFTDNLNLIKEGIILYQGIKYTAEINELGKWNSELDIFLSTEHLFNALGYNGVLYQQIFDDFYSLVTEINLSNKSKSGERLIELKYLEETQEEVTAFFQTAELIQKGRLALDTSKPAMKSILEDCKSPSDIIAKKIKFENDLKRKGITIREFTRSVYDYPEYVVEDENIIDLLKKSSESKSRYFDETACRRFFKIFTRINYLRGGESKSKFEKIGSIFITGNRFALYLAHQSKVKFGEDDIPFAKDIDFITNKFWFKLKKGFSNKDSLPKSFDVVTKAQIILSSQLNQSVYQEYNKLQKQLKDGSLIKEEVVERSYELREKPNKPEELTIETIDNSLDFLINDDFFEDLSREKETEKNFLKEVLREKEELANEIKRRDQSEKQEKLALEEVQYEVAKENYVIQSWEDYKIEQHNNLRYFLTILFLTVLPIIIGFILKVSKSLDSWMQSIGNKQYWIWGILVIMFLVEAFGRSYLFDKEKIKLGWSWLMVIIDKNKHVSLKNKKFVEFENQF